MTYTSVRLPLAFLLLCSAMQPAMAANLLIHADGDAYKGDPVMRVKADGTSLGDITVPDGYKDYKLAIPDGTSKLSIAFINDLNEGGKKDRDINIEHILVNGKPVAGKTVFSANGERSYDVSALTKAPVVDNTPKAKVVIRASGDAYMGDPTMVIKVDDEILTKLDVATGFKDYTFDAPLNLKTVSLAFINDLNAGRNKDRDINIESIYVNGLKVSGPFVFAINGEKTFTVGRVTPSEPKPPTDTPTTPTTPELPIGGELAIFNHSPSIKPGESFNLQGNFSDKARVMYRTSEKGAAQPLRIRVQRQGQVTAQIPASAVHTLYDVWVEDGKFRSRRVLINHPQGIHFDSPESYAGGPLRIFGRNLEFGSLQPRVLLQEPDSDSFLEAKVDAKQSDAYQLRVTLPDGLKPGVKYQIVLSNGVSTSRMSKTLLAIAPGEDDFDLNVGWAAKIDYADNVFNVRTDPRLSKKAVGNGVASDQEAIQAAIDKASASGGGVVYLPEGIYKLSNPKRYEHLRMKSRVVLQGAGKDKTILRFGYDLGEQHTALFWKDSRQNGIADLSFVNMDRNGHPNVATSRGPVAESFMQRVRFDIKKGSYVEVSNSDKVVVANSDFSQEMPTVLRGTFSARKSSNWVIRNNQFNFVGNGLQLDDGHDWVLENNRILRDGSIPSPAESVNHMISVNFSENTATLNNLFEVIKGRPVYNNDGESYCAEGGGPNRLDEESGTVTGAGASTLIDSSKSWSAGMERAPYVAILHGKGVGQYRKIVSRSGQTLNLDRPWDVVPTAGSRYAIFNWGLKDVLVQGNIFRNNQRGIDIYKNATLNMAIVDNQLIDSNSIDLRPVHQNREKEGIVADPMYNIQVVGNSVTNLTRANGAFIGVHAEQHVLPKSIGTMMTGLEVRRNVVTAGSPNTPARVTGVYVPEGFVNYLQWNSGKQAFVDENIPVVLGSIFEDNTAINADNALTINSGSYNTFVCNLKSINAPSQMSPATSSLLGLSKVIKVSNGIIDLKVGQASRGAVGTTECQ